MATLMRRRGVCADPVGKPVAAFTNTAGLPVAALVDFHTPSERTAA